MSPRLLLALVLTILVLVIVSWEVPHRLQHFQTNSASPTDEHAQIDQWLANHNLNAYGDAPETVYAGGTPLFDEATGRTISRYDYIKAHHPEKPWQNQ